MRPNLSPNTLCWSNQGMICCFKHAPVGDTWDNEQWQGMGAGALVMYVTENHKPPRCEVCEEMDRRQSIQKIPVAPTATEIVARLASVSMQERADQECHYQMEWFKAQSPAPDINSKAHATYLAKLNGYRMGYLDGYMKGALQQEMIEKHRARTAGK